MTVTDLLLNFRQALLAVVPTVEKVGTSWRRLDAYDEWDAIASALFNALVFEVLRWSQPERLKERFRLPDYDLLLQSYAGLCVLEVVHPALPSGHHIFHAFGTRKSPFDVVELRRVSETGEPYEQDLTVCPVEGANFRLRLDPALNNGHVIEEVTIAQ